MSIFSQLLRLRAAHQSCALKQMIARLDADKNLTAISFSSVESHHHFLKHIPATHRPHSTIAQPLKDLNMESKPLPYDLGCELDSINGTAKPEQKLHRSNISQDEVTFQQLVQYIVFNDIQLFDVRTDEEVEQTGMIPSATNIPLSEVAKALSLDADKFHDRYGVEKPGDEDSNIVFSCRSGIRSRHALDLAVAAGYSNARHYVGGWKEYYTQTKKYRSAADRLHHHHS